MRFDNQINLKALTPTQQRPMTPAIFSNGSEWETIKLCLVFNGFRLANVKLQNAQKQTLMWFLLLFYPLAYMLWKAFMSIWAIKWQHINGYTDTNISNIYKFAHVTCVMGIALLCFWWIKVLMVYFWPVYHLMHADSTIYRYQPKKKNQLMMSLEWRAMKMTAIDRNNIYTSNIKQSLSFRFS